MKKILCLILALVLCFTVFVACDNTQTEDPAVTTLENATAYLKTMYKGYLTNPETPADYELVTSLMVDGQTYTVEWSVDNEAVKVVVAEDGSKVTIDIDEKSSSVAEYNLSAVVTAPDGTKGEPLTFKLKVPSANFLPIADALKAEDGTFVTVSGTVVLINTPWDDGYKNITVTIEDENGDQLYLYRLSTNVEIGDVIMVKGEMATYNGNRQMAQGCTAEIIGKEEIKTEYIDMTIPEALKADDNTLVCVKGTVKVINTAWSDQYKNISVTIVDKDGNELYLFRLSTNVEVGDVLTVKGVMATYNGNRQVAQGATAEITGKQDIVLEYPEKTIPEAIALNDGELVTVKGTVKSVDIEWSEDYKNISVTIVDAEGNELYIYRLATKVEAGDTLTIKGIVGSYQGKKQIVSGTAEIGSAHGDNHVYTNACDADCDVCGAERTPAEHVYDNACDADCNVCNAEREVEGHKYDSACDADCNTCGSEREVSGHEYSNDCDADCNLCGAKREGVAHSYKNACDTECDDCGAKRTVAGHVYDNACDADCNECNERREAAAHVYDNACDADCNVCGAKRETSHTTVAECDEECDVCGAKIENAAEHTWATECDKICDKCNEPRPVDCKDDNDDGKCDYCGETVDAASIEKGHIEYEAAKIKFNDVHVSGEAALPAVGVGYADVAITWTVDKADVAKIADGKVTFTAGAEDVTVTLTATFVCGGTTDTKTYTVKVTAHAYDNACDADCNVCLTTRKVEGHKYDDCTDVDCNTCGTKREAQEHYYENACATKCSKCGTEREVGGHQYANCEAVVCSECNEPRTAPGHTFSNDCDAECNECDATRTPAAHVYDNACDAGCNVCGETRTPAAHVYDNCADAACNVCNATRTAGTCADNNSDDKCDTCDAEMASFPKVGVAYKWYLTQNNLGKILYFKGEMVNNFYFATTENSAEAVDIYFEKVDGGYNMYFELDGAKKYIAIINTGSHYNVVFDQGPSLFVYNAELNTMVTDVEENGTKPAATLYIGTYSTYNSFSASTLDKAPTSFVSQFTEEAIDSTECNHNYKDATCTAGKTCTLCGNVDGNALGHTEPDANGLCTRCQTNLSFTPVKDALGAAEGTEVTLMGTISKIYQDYNSEHNNISFYLTDDNGDTILCFRVTGNWAVGDIVKVSGKVTLYNGVNQIAQGGTVEKVGTCEHDFADATCHDPKTCKTCGATEGLKLGHTYENGICIRCDAPEPVLGATLPSNLVFTDAANKASADSYMAEHFPEWTISGTLGQTYGGYLGFGRSGDKNSAITSSAISVNSAFTITTVLKGNGSNGEMTSTLTFTLVDATGNTVATGYAGGVSAINPVDAKDTTYNISFTFVSGKTWTDVANLVVTFEKGVGNIGLKTLDFVK